MSLFNWFAAKKKQKSEKAHPPASSGLSRIDSTKPFNAAHGSKNAPATAQAANRKGERMARRELLYAIVREAMVRAGVLSSSYKFKVLSLDTRGRQFLVMVDLAEGAGRETAHLAEIEAMVAQAAKSRYDIVVTAVYWRSIEHVAVGEPSPAPRHKGPSSRPSPLGGRGEDSHPAPLLETNSHPAELVAAPERRGAARFEPLHPDEVAAFQRALAAGVAAQAPAPAPAPAAPSLASRGEAALAKVPPAPASAAPGGAGAVARGFDGSAKHGPQSYTLLTGFEDTEMPESETPTAAALSATQYGELR